MNSYIPFCDHISLSSSRNEKGFKQKNCTGKQNAHFNNNNNNNNNNNIYFLQLGCHPVAVVCLHVYKTWNWLLLNFFFPPRISCRLWDNVEKYFRPGQAKYDSMAHAHCMLDTHTNIQNIILIAFLQPQRLHERSSLLHYTYIACLLHCSYREVPLPYFMYVPCSLYIVSISTNNAHEYFYFNNIYIKITSTLGSFTLHFGLKYEIIYQLDAIEYLFVFFQLDMFRAYTPPSGAMGVTIS